MQGDPKIDDLMRPVNAAIRRHVKDAAAVTDIYNRAYEAVMEVQDALNVSAAVTAQQIAENAKNLQRAEAAEAENERLHARNKELEDNFSAFIGHLRCGHNEKAHLQMLVLEVLVDEGKKYGADKGRLNK